MYTIKDELDILWTGLKIRVKDTFTSTFVIAWVVWNWRAVLFVIYLMKWDLTERLDYIDKVIYSGTYWNLTLLVLGPLVSTLLFLILLPRLTNWIDKKYHELLVQRRRNQASAQTGLLYTDEEVALVRATAKRLELPYCHVPA